jgi:2-polyprenyl-3-methyl-5-hydroxy-6-metoxy-1,4-benzoquinol methylase
MIDSLQELADRSKRQMNQLPIHETWEKDYRTAENEKVFELAYDRIVETLGQPPESRALDIGCGICANSIRLARRGYIVSAGDYSEPILDRARENVAQNELSDRISIAREDIYNLSFPNEHFDLVLCWGVMMHLPDTGRAIAELIRVVKPGGYLVLEEINQNSPESRVLRLFWSTLKKKKITSTRTPAGVEHGCTFNNELLFWRHTNPRWLIDQFESRSCTLFRRDCSLCSDLPLFFPGLRAPVSAWNRFWLRRVNLPGLSYHNIFTFRKNPG